MPRTVRDPSVGGTITDASIDPQVDETQLCARLQEGDVSAFEAVYRQYVQLVFRFCRSRCDDASDTEDAMSIVFLEAWKNRQSARVVNQTLRPWMLSIALNVVQNHNRSARRYSAAIGRYRKNFRPSAVDVESIVSRRSDKDMIHDGIRRLSRKLRVVAELAFVDELSLRDVAAVLNLSESTVRSRVALARSRLQLILRSGEPVDAADMSGPLPYEFQRGARARTRRVDA